MKYNIKQYSWEVATVLLFIVFINFSVITYIGYMNNQYKLNLSQSNVNDIANYYYRDVFGNQKVFGKNKDEIEVAKSDFSQQKKYTCGPAALRFLLYHFGIDITEKKLGQLIDTDKSGSTLYGMVQAVDQLGLKGVGIKANYTRLKELRKPVIAFVKGDHYVVIDKVEGNYIYLFDPAYEGVKIHRNEFLNVWNGVIMLVKTKPIQSYCEFSN
jgi:hypothetical protein